MIEKLGAIFELWGSLGWSCRICIINGGKETVNLIDGDKAAPIEAVYLVVLEFINWYNKNKGDINKNL